MKVITILVVFVTISNVCAVEARKIKLENGSTRNKRDAVSNCSLLKEKFKSYRPSDKMIRMLLVSRPMRIHVMSTYRASSRALAALLAAAIRYAAGYEDVYTMIDNRTMYQLAVDVPVYSAREQFSDNIMYIHVDADLEEPKMDEPLLYRCSPDIFTCSIAGPRLLDLGRTPSVNLHVYSVLSNKSLHNSKCIGANTWSFYRNNTTLQECDFKLNLYNKNYSFPIYTMEDVQNSTHTGSFRNELDSFIDDVPFRTFLINRIELNALLEDVDKSFIFIDYELGYKKIDRHVEVVQLPPQSTITEPIVAMRVADHYFIRRFAPHIENILNWLRPQPEDLRQILSTDAALKNISEAACSWATDNPDKFRAWNRKEKENTTLLFIIILCENSDLGEYLKLYGNLNESLKEILKDDIKLFEISVGCTTVNCSDDSKVSHKLLDITKNSKWPIIAGVAVPRSVISSSTKLQVVYYDIPPPTTSLHDGISISFGSLQQLTNSVRHFFKKQGWSRVAIISEKSSLAENITAELSREIINYKQKILTNLDAKSIAEVLLNFKNANARIFYINAELEVANLIMCEAEKLGMVTDDDEYAWIAREWQPSAKCYHRIQVFTISYWWNGVNETFIKDFGGNSKIRELIKEKLWRNTSWPILAEPIIDAVLLMVYRVEMMLRNHPDQIHDLHTSIATKLMEDQLNGKDIVSGVVHKIHQIQNMQYNPFVYVTSWRGNVSNLVAIWRIQNDTIEETVTIYEPYYGGKRPHDGSTKCITTMSGDLFTPFCHDPIWLSLVAIILFLSVIIWKTRQRILLRFKRQERKTLMRLLSRCEKTAAVLEPYLVDRSALELHEELGTGHFGRVRLGMLRAGNRLPTPIAAKTLRENAAPAEEAEFLREVSMLAILTHDHIIRLVGACADADGPPLLLMDHAFFGDLLKYLRQRRHLVEIYERNSRVSDVSVEEKALKESLDPEARHVSPEELTRLAREAAQALDYLSGKHILHRDIRAANCLIDARRVLKLADFGMARRIDVKTRCPLDDPNEPDDYKYICCRRGVFPVPWMAPESLKRGEFSHASDVWALGVLMVEIATLGARPYGSWSPLQVFRFVRSGGRPPLPRDASYHTCEVTEICWTELPAKRATAKEVVDYLVDQPTTLRGAWRPAWLESTEVPDGSDSGFSDKATEQDWPKGDDLRVSTL